MDDDEKSELLSWLFAVMTARLEDGAAIAADGQGRHPAAEQVERATQLVEIGNEVAALGEAMLVSAGTAD